MSSSSLGGCVGDGHDLYRPVWVKLFALFLRHPAAPMPDKLPHVNALDTTAEVPGLVLQWLRSGGGEWLAQVSYEIPFADGRTKRAHLERQLVPAYALRPRSYA